MASFTIDDEDIELVQSISGSLNTLKQSYELAFKGMLDPKQAQREGRK